VLIEHAFAVHVKPVPADRVARLGKEDLTFENAVSMRGANAPDLSRAIYSLRRVGGCRRRAS
jgi:hypothetical protein